ncbi:MAG TPA: fibronectin type III domain-containing protein [Thermoanaerobaculia bacterium]|nr:fibronectin type III domain-containing protein [Thermoanaerobaculia bacterium]
MRKLFLLSILSILLPLALSSTAEGRSGCCSSHGGVCGCRCCDGTPLSNVCSCGPTTTIPSAPSGLGSTVVSSSRISLSWIDNSSDETSFRIESRTDLTAFVEIGSVGANVTSTFIGNLTPDTIYYFRILAVNAAGNSRYAGPTSVRTPPVEVPVPVCTDATPCFTGNRFKVEARWQTRDGGSGNATTVRLTGDSGYLWFFNASNVEVVFKVIDACSARGYFWFFAGGLTNVQTTITVTDTVTNRVKTYVNPQGTAFLPIQDNQAFACQ